MKVFGDQRNISGNSSILMDSLRIIAAMIVFICHAYDQWHYPSGGHPYSLLDIAHPAVVVFFVLSGYVIAHTTTSNNRGRLLYAQARLSRLYSVVIPALVITAICQLIVWNIDPQLHSHYTRGSSFSRYILSGVFFNEIWFFSAGPPINGPLWSLSFEFWYYVIFGCWFYRTKGLKGLLLPLIACLVAGPKILIMMPIWLTGNLVYRLRRPAISTAASWGIIFTSLLICCLLVVYLPLWPHHVGAKPLFFASQFITDWIIGIFVAVALWLLPEGSMKSKDTPVKPWVKIYRKAADLTFPIYVLHFPLLILWRAVFGVGSSNVDVSMTIAIVVITLICVIIGNFLENWRNWWTSFFKKILNGTRKAIKKPQYQKV